MIPLHAEQSLVAYLDKGIEQSQWQYDHSCKRSRHQHDNANLQKFEHIAQHHLQPIRDHAINGVYLFRETIEKVTTGCTLKERHRRVKYIVEKVQMKMPGCNYSSKWNGHSSAKNCNSCNTTTQLMIKNNTKSKDTQRGLRNTRDFEPCAKPRAPKTPSFRSVSTCVPFTTGSSAHRLSQ